jgi:hypothetical protein
MNDQEKSPRPATAEAAGWAMAALAGCGVGLWPPAAQA